MTDIDKKSYTRPNKNGPLRNYNEKIKKKMNNLKRRAAKNPTEFLPIFICFYEQLVKTRVAEKIRHYFLSSAREKKKKKWRPSESESPIFELPGRRRFLFFLSIFSDMCRREIAGSIAGIH